MNCPQCQVFAEAINQIVATGTKEREENFGNRISNEIRLLNIQTFVSLLELSLATAAAANDMPEGWKTVSRQAWTDIYCMIHHINEALIEMLPED